MQELRLVNSRWNDEELVSLLHIILASQGKANAPNADQVSSGLKGNEADLKHALLNSRHSRALQGTQKTASFSRENGEK